MGKLVYFAGTNISLGGYVNVDKILWMDADLRENLTYIHLDDGKTLASGESIKTLTERFNAAVGDEEKTGERDA